MAPLVVFVLDAVLVVVFSTLGRIAHSEELGVTQVWGTAWPFLVGLALGWAILLIARRRPTAVRTGVALWLVTLVVGMVIRGLDEGRVPHWSFMIVAGVALAVFLIGWRAIRAGLTRRGHRGDSR